jgi:uncharacterized protein
MKTRLTHRAVSAMGGRAVPAEKRTFSRDRTKASEAGRKGGLASAAARNAARKA